VANGAHMLVSEYTASLRRVELNFPFQLGNKFGERKVKKAVPAVESADEEFLKKH